MRPLIFDLDGTLSDPLPGIARSIQHALARLGEPVPEERALAWCIGPPLIQSLERMLGDAVRAEEGLRLYRERFAVTGLFENALYPGVGELLETLRQRGHRLLVCTSKPHVFAERILAHFHIRGFFSDVFGAELDGRLGDKGELLAHLLAKTGLAATGVGSDAFMIGDRLHDIQAARRNGLESIGVLYGYGSREELEEAGADHLLDSPMKLVDLLADLLDGTS